MSRRGQNWAWVAAVAVMAGAGFLFVPRAQGQARGSLGRASSLRSSPAYRAATYGHTNAVGHDSLEGEHVAVRRLAVRALGKLNGSVVVVDADSGRILSIVNQPLALAGGFKPCSTIKVAVGLGALQEGLITSRTRLRTGSGRRFNLTEALAESSNSYFALLGRKMGFEKVSGYMRQLGFGELAGYRLDGEQSGSIPLVEPASGGGVGRLSSYGEAIKVTPFGLAAVMAAFANGGTLYYLQYPRTKEEAEQFQPRIKRTLPIKRSLAQLRLGMRAAVKTGTASWGWRGDEVVLGKTGTCRGDFAQIGWFASYGVLPSRKRVAVVVLLVGGSDMSGPRAAVIAARIYRGLPAVFPRAIRPRARQLATVSAGDD